MRKQEGWWRKANRREVERQLKSPNNFNSDLPGSGSLCAEGGEKNEQAFSHCLFVSQFVSPQRVKALEQRTVTNPTRKFSLLPRYGVAVISVKYNTWCKELAIPVFHKSQVHRLRALREYNITLMASV